VVEEQNTNAFYEFIRLVLSPVLCLCPHKHSDFYSLRLEKRLCLSEDFSGCHGDPTTPVCSDDRAHGTVYWIFIFPLSAAKKVGWSGLDQERRVVLYKVSRPFFGRD